MCRQKWCTLLLAISLLLNIALCIWGVNMQIEQEELKFIQRKADQTFHQSFSDLHGHFCRIPTDEADWDVWFAEGEIYARACWHQLGISSFADDDELSDIFHQLTIRFTFSEGAPSDMIPESVVEALGRLHVNMEDSALKSEIHAALCSD
ncbi:MAG: hypothetical protein IJY12_04230 [Clostridia bacterium]|nr:hypothetical protein [Clostridia bacterium]